MAETQEKLYGVDTPELVSAWVADETDSMTRGWVPLTSDLQSHGSLRVIYGRVWPELHDPGTVLPFAAPAAEDPSDGSARLGGLTALIALLAIVTTYAVFARL